MLPAEAFSRSLGGRSPFCRAVRNAEYSPNPTFVDKSLSEIWLVNVSTNYYILLIACKRIVSSKYSTCVLRTYCTVHGICRSVVLHRYSTKENVLLTFNKQKKSKGSCSNGPMVGARRFYHTDMGSSAAPAEDFLQSIHFCEKGLVLIWFGDQHRTAWPEIRIKSENPTCFFDCL